jgi:LacI family transcriptional regulator
VSRVINGKGYVSAEKRERILKLVEKTGYVPNRAARNMGMRRSFAVGIMIPDMFNNFQRQLFSIIERQLESLGYHTIFFFVKPDAASERDCLTHLKSEKLDGVILLHEIKDQDFYQYLKRANIPVVSTICSGSRINTITIDDKNAAREAVLHLAGLGHRKIAMISGSGFFSFDGRRIEGYRQALKEKNIPLDKRLLIPSSRFTFESGMYSMRELLLRSRAFTAVFASSDELALGALRTMQDEGIKVPEDISIVGFDNIELSNYLFPRLTTINQPLRDLGQKSTDLLHRLILGKGASEAELLLPHNLIIRESTCSIKAFA